MIGEDLGAQRHGVTGTDGVVGPDLKRQLVIVGHIANAGVFHGEVDLVYRRVDGVDGNHTDHGLCSLVLVSRNIAAAMAQRNLHVKRSIGAQGADVKLGIQNLNFAVCLDVTGAYLPLAHGLNIDGLGTLAVQLRNDALDV